MSETQVFVLLVLVVVEVHGGNDHRGEPERLDERRDGNRPAERAELDRRGPECLRERLRGPLRLGVRGGSAECLGRGIAQLEARYPRMAASNLSVWFSVDEVIAARAHVCADLVE